GEKAEKVLLTGAAIVGGLGAILLFTVLPTMVTAGVGHFIELGRWPRVILEGVLKVAIFLSYMYLISRMKEIERVFRYHGAEHKTIACYEAGDPLTVENVRKYTRFHPRCGTSFLILVVIISVFLYSVLPWSSTGLRVLLKLLLLPVVMGISYEVLKWCGRSDSLFSRIVRQPRLWVQRLTVFEPDDSMIEVAIEAVRPVLPDRPEGGRGWPPAWPPGRPWPRWKPAWQPPAARTPALTPGSCSGRRAAGTAGGRPGRCRRGKPPAWKSCRPAGPAGCLC